MDEAVATRRAAFDAVGDVEPTQLRDRIEHHLDTGSMLPGVLTILSVRAGAATGPATNENDALLDPVARRAAGVQLIYDGLRLTRGLAQDEPWTAGEKETGDLDVLVADVLVARGFYLLARTEAANKAVETVRAFGHDQTVREVTGDATLDQNLERDVVRLAIVAGAGLREPGSATGVTELAADITDEFGTDGFPTADAFGTDRFLDQLVSVADSGAEDGLTTSVDD
jgi:hypothetical protein